MRVVSGDGSVALDPILNGCRRGGPFAQGLFLNVPVRGKVAGQPGQHANLRANLQRMRPRSLSSVQRARGIKPGTPVPTTVLNRMFVDMPYRISRMASSGRVEMSKFCWIY